MVLRLGEGVWSRPPTWLVGGRAKVDNGSPQCPLQSQGLKGTPLGSQISRACPTVLPGGPAESP